MSKKKRASKGSPNLIISGKTPVPESEQPSVPHWEKYDTEFDDPDLKDPKIAAAIAEYEKRVNTKSHTRHVEDALMEYERNYVMMRQHQWPGQERWLGKQNEEMRMVRIMHPYRFIYLLNQAGVRAEIANELTDSYCGRHIRVWLNSFVALKSVRVEEPAGSGKWITKKIPSGLVGVNAWIPDEVLGCRVAKTVTTLQYPYGPEYCILRFNEYNIPVSRKYKGWRTALLGLITNGVITEAEAERAFGKAVGLASMFYREQLFNFRKYTMGMISKFGVQQ